jgi:hypothetical protein
VRNREREREREGGGQFEGKVMENCFREQE